MMGALKKHMTRLLSSKQSMGELAEQRRKLVDQVDKLANGGKKSVKMPFQYQVKELDLVGKEQKDVIDVMINSVGTEKAVIFDPRGGYSAHRFDGKGPFLASAKTSEIYNWDVSKDVSHRNAVDYLVKSIIQQPRDMRDQSIYKQATQILVNLIGQLQRERAGRWQFENLLLNMTNPDLMIEQSMHMDDENNLGLDEDTSQKLAKFFLRGSTLAKHLTEKEKKGFNTISLTNWVTNDFEEDNILIVRGSPTFPEINDFVIDQIYGKLLSDAAELHSTYRKTIWSINQPSMVSPPICFSWNRGSKLGT